LVFLVLLTARCARLEEMGVLGVWSGRLHCGKTRNRLSQGRRGGYLNNAGFVHSVIAQLPIVVQLPSHVFASPSYSFVSFKFSNDRSCSG
jgi:hypothetical protein